ncbi:MAG: DUF2155 domain-containing protein [Rickettsiales bacterium]|nr:DUF2155 domain-containing protein [Rickettsiales bacterium]
MINSNIKFFVVLFFLIVGSARANDINSFLNELENEENVTNTKNLIKNQPKNRFVDKVKLHGLNKITGKTSTLNGVIGESIQFEKLEISLLKCWKSYPEENTENKLLLKIFEVDGEKKELIFYGWFFSSSPSVSGLEHPLYDLKLLDCEKIED